MKFLGVDLKFGSFDVWHKGNLINLSQLNNDLPPVEPEIHKGTTAPADTNKIWIDTN
jgi:hypothetical protein